MRTKTFLVSALLLVPAAAALLPLAAAHDCSAENPERSCGECLAGNHNHTYNDNSPYCASRDGDEVCLLWDALGLGGRCGPLA